MVAAAAAASEEPTTLQAAPQLRDASLRLFARHHVDQIVGLAPECRPREADGARVALLEEDVQFAVVGRDDGDDVAGELEMVVDVLAATRVAVDHQVRRGARFKVRRAQPFAGPPGDRTEREFDTAELREQFGFLGDAAMYQGAAGVGARIDRNARFQSAAEDMRSMSAEIRLSL